MKKVIVSNSITADDELFETYYAKQLVKGLQQALDAMDAMNKSTFDECDCEAIYDEVASAIQDISYMLERK